MKFPCCFLHYFDIHFLESKIKMFCTREHVNAIYNEALLATKFAALCSHELILPLASIHESTICREVLSELSFDEAPWTIRFTANAISPGDFYDSRLSKYPKDTWQFEIYESALQSENDYIHFSQRKGSATQCIENNIQSMLQCGNIPTLFQHRKEPLPSDLEEKISKLPELIEDKAYLSEIIFDSIGWKNYSLGQQVKLTNELNKGYFQSYLENIYPPPAVLWGLSRLDSDCINFEDYLHIPFKFLHDELWNYPHIREILLKGSGIDLLKIYCSDDWEIVSSAAIAKAQKYWDMAHLLEKKQQTAHPEPQVKYVFNNSKIGVVGDNANSNTTTFSDGEKEATRQQLLDELASVINELKKNNPEQIDLPELESAISEFETTGNLTPLTNFGEKLATFAENVGAGVVASAIWTAIV